MFALLLRDGSRTEIDVPDFLEAMRLALRLDAAQLVVPGDPPRSITADQVLKELALDRPGLFEPYASDWTPPTAAEFRELLRVADLSGSEAGMLLGVDSRKIRKWASAEKADMPYAVWRLLSIYSGLAEAPKKTNNEITK